MGEADVNNLVKDEEEELNSTQFTVSGSFLIHSKEIVRTTHVTSMSYSILSDP